MEDSHVEEDSSQASNAQNPLILKAAQASYSTIGGNQSASLYSSEEGGSGTMMRLNLQSSPQFNHQMNNLYTA